MYVNVASTAVEPILAAVKAVGGVMSVRIDRAGPNRCVIAVELPASAEFVQRGIADRAIAAALQADPTVELDAS